MGVMGDGSAVLRSTAVGRDQPEPEGPVVIGSFRGRYRVLRDDRQQRPEQALVGCQALFRQELQEGIELPGCRAESLGGGRRDL